VHIVHSGRQGDEAAAPELRIKLFGVGELIELEPVLT
jgi:hypothetical protein